MSIDGGDMTANALQWLVFGGLTLLMAVATTIMVRRMGGARRTRTANISWPAAI